MKKLLFPPFITDKRGESKMTPRMAAPIKRAAEFRKVVLKACHCAQEFTLWQICSLGHWEKLA
jgi:hypothetical protein